MRAWPIALACFAALTACAGSSKSSSKTNKQELVDFECNQRRAEYTVTGGFAAAELGISMKCTDTGATITRWTVDTAGTKKQKQSSMEVGVFDAYWKRIEASGWQQMKNCDYIGDKNDPVYQYELADRSDRVDFSCQAKRQSLPFPYDSLVNELETAARNHIR
jgi:hypothetical protein